MTPPTCGYCSLNSDFYCEDHDIEVTAAYRKGQMDKEAEIIKLLEDEELHTHPNNLMKNYDELVWLGIKEQLIALIKGEK